VIGPLYRYGMLVFVLGLFAWAMHSPSTRPPGYEADPHGRVFLVLMLLFTHLAYAFKWPKRVGTALSVLAWSWMGFTIFYTIFWW
jgi:hypothetical protein